MTQTDKLEWLMGELQGLIDVYSQDMKEMRHKETQSFIGKDSIGEAYYKGQYRLMHDVVWDLEDLLEEATGLTEEARKG